jgi:hypothetical protein
LASRERFLCDLARAALTTRTSDLSQLIERLRRTHLAAAMAEMNDGGHCDRFGGDP